MFNFEVENIFGILVVVFVILIITIFIAIGAIDYFIECGWVKKEEKHDLKHHGMTYSDLLKILCLDLECTPFDHVMFGDYRTATEHLKNIVRYWENHCENGRLPWIVEKKVFSIYYNAILMGDKSFEIRLDKDNVQPGDILILREVDMFRKCTGNSIVKKVKYVLRDCPEYGLKRGYCIISF